MNEQSSNTIVVKIAALFLVFSGLFLAIMSMALGKDPGEFISKFMLICFTGLFYGIFGALCYSIFNKENFKPLSLAGVLICLCGFLFTTIVIIAESQGKSMFKVLSTFFILSIALAQISMLYKINIINKYAAISRVIAIAAISVFTLIIIVFIFGLENVDFYDLSRGRGFTESLGRGISAILSLDFAFTAATPLLNKIPEGRFEVVDLEPDFLKDVEPENDEEQKDYL
jgi:hypothetical protein